MVIKDNANLDLKYICSWVSIMLHSLFAKKIIDERRIKNGGPT